MASDNATFEKQVLDLTNQERAKAGLQPLKGNAELDYAADKYAEDMSERGVLSHTGPDGSQPWDRAKAVGYEAQTMGENIAAGQKTPEQVVQAWMNSPGHRANILNPNYTELGVGFHDNYWGQLFGSGDTNPASNIPTGTNQGTGNDTLPSDKGSNNTMPEDKGTTVPGDKGSNNTMPEDKGTTVPGDKGSNNTMPEDKGTTVPGDKGSNNTMPEDKGTTVPGDKGSNNTMPEDKGTTVPGDKGSNNTMPEDKSTTVPGDKGSNNTMPEDKGTTVPGDKGSNNTMPEDKAGNDATFEKQVLELTNQERAKAGLQPLKGNAELDYAADKYAEDMSERGVLSHTGPDGSQAWDRAKAVGYESQYFGENIAAGQRTPEEVVQDWMNSPGHRANILNSNYTELGVGFHDNYWSQSFGSGDTNPASNIPNPTSNSGSNPTSQPTSDANQGTDTLTVKGVNNISDDTKGYDVLGGKSGNNEFKGGDSDDVLTGKNSMSAPGRDRHSNSMQDKGDTFTASDSNQDITGLHRMMTGPSDHRNSKNFSNYLKMDTFGAEPTVRPDMDGNTKPGGLEKNILSQNADPSRLTTNSMF
ncbi:CAP domain-containing protein [Fischerella sp. PCC 9605]|uniref:CAP domain-containing protein n=1 Tax=Fischerella sp. PCC 9605 TaxID=1173024 RepID=UPI001E3A8562|nr:CAP domain-containing protein [Fischerella sp. PCC 9605]